MTEEHNARKFIKMGPSTFLVLATLLAFFVLSLVHYNTSAAITSLASLSENTLQERQRRAVADPKRRHPHYLFAIAEESLQLSEAFDQSNISLLEHALERDGGDAFAWANLAYLRTRDAGRLNDAAKDALRNSIALCRLCDRALLKWRLEFVLATWGDTPEDIRMAVFEGADLLRWWHLEGEYIHRLNRRSRQDGLPFRYYQQRVGTAVRPTEIGLPPDEHDR